MNVARDRYERAWFTAGNLVLSAEEKFNTLRDQLESVAVDIFALRVDGLELERPRILRLFSGNYLDAELSEIAGRLNSARSAIVAMENLLTAAKSELVATQSALASAKSAKEKAA
jgi:hypothetical protein